MARGSGSGAHVVYEMEANPETRRACGSRPSLRLVSDSPIGLLPTTASGASLPEVSA